MNWKLLFFISAFLCVCVTACLIAKLRRVNKQLSIINDALNDIKNGNLNRRVLARKNDMIKDICYAINEITVNSQAQLFRAKQSEQAYKRLMTSLSHDIKTPLASLVGYLEAIQEKIVNEEEKEEYIKVALNKAYRLKNFVLNLFEWVKLDAKEQIFKFEICDLNELSRNIMAEWIPVMEDKQFEYEINIPEQEYNICLDRNAYARILNNLIQNSLMHSKGSKISISISENEHRASIIVEDNGTGIPDKDLPHVFERLYRADESRSTAGNGLGLSIVHELVSVHGGTINIKKPSGGGVSFHIIPPKAT